MQFTIFKTSDDYNQKPPHPKATLYSTGNTYVIEINTLEELLHIIKDLKEEVIVSVDDCGEFSLEVYDTWRE